MQKTVYLDYNATTPVHEKVLEKMLPFFNERFGNASSKWHSFGWEANAHVEDSRKIVAESINAEPSEIIFTSGSTEAINAALKGLSEVYPNKKQIVVVSTEHMAVLDTVAHLETKGFELVLIDVDAEGRIDMEKMEKSITENTLCFCCMAVNNETGVIQDIEQIGAFCKSKSCFFFCDATQAVGKMQVDVQEMNIDLLCLSAHKIYGPKGVGALYLRRKNPRVKIATFLYGGGHENQIRSGTLNVSGIVGMAAAVQWVNENYWENTTLYSKLRNAIEHSLLDLPGIRINGSTRYRISNTSNLCFSGKLAVDIIKHCPDFALSTGSACSSAIPKPSHVLKAMNLSDADAYASLRVSVGIYTNEKDIKRFTDTVKRFYE